MLPTPNNKRKQLFMSSSRAKTHIYTQIRIKICIHQFVYVKKSCVHQLLVLKTDKKVYLSSCNGIITISVFFIQLLQCYYNNGCFISSLHLYQIVISTIRVRLHFNLVNKCVPLILLSVLCQYFMFFIYCMCMLDHLKHKNISKTQYSMRNVMAFLNQNKMSCICPFIYILKRRSQCKSFGLSCEHDSLLHKHSFFFFLFFFLYGSY